MSARKRSIPWLVIPALAFSSAAHAYLDPGTGSILLQGLLAGIAGAIAVGSLYWRRFKSFFRRTPTSDSDDHGPDRDGPR